MGQSTYLKVLIIFIGGLCALLGLLVLIGWHTANEQLIQVLPIFVPMQYNTALGFLFAGLGLLVIILNQHDLLGKILFSIVGAIGLLTILQYLLGISFGIDEILMEHYITVETSHPGRMAPNTALCFLLTSVAIILALSKEYKKIRISGVLGSLVFGLGLVAFVGYLINMEVTYGWGKLTNMAVHTALGFMTMGTGITSFSIFKEINYSVGNRINNDFWLSGYSFTFALTIFFIDLSLPLGIAAGTLYVPIMLFAWFIKRQYITQVLVGLASLLIFLGFIFSKGGAEQWMVIANRGFSVMVIWVVGALLYNIKKKEYALLTTNNELDLHLVQLKNKNKELAQFTYIASHDLQEPLRTVTNFTKLFEEQYQEKLDEQANLYLAFISQASNRMSNLIKGLLDYSRIGHSKSMSYVDLNSLLKELQVDLHSTIDETGTKFKIEALPKVKGFKVELGLLFQNLILNAIKFRRQKEYPEIIISARDKLEHYEFSVRDNGIGIANEYHDKIFSIFKRLHTQKEYEGTGIGLAHCEKIVALHEGTIRVSSVPEQGSNFIFTIKKY